MKHFAPIFDHSLLNTSCLQKEKQQKELERQLKEKQEAAEQRRKQQEEARLKREQEEDERKRQERAAQQGSTAGEVTFIFMQDKIH